MEQTKTGKIVMGPDAIAAIRTAKTSDLIATLGDPERIADVVADRLAEAGAGEIDEASLKIFWDAIAAEIDRRIPVPDPRIGKLCRPPHYPHPMCVVGVEPGGVLRLRAASWTRAAEDMRVDPDLIAPGDWLDG